MVLLRCKFCGSININKDMYCLNCNYSLQLFEVDFVYMKTIESLDVGIIGGQNENENKVHGK